jgi:hypothetical protein
MEADKNISLLIEKNIYKLFFCDRSFDLDTRV